MKRGVSWFAWLWFLIGAFYFIVPLWGTLVFSLQKQRGTISFAAYEAAFADPKFLETFLFSNIMAVFTIIASLLLIVPTAYWVRLRLPRLRPVVEFITLLPLVIPAIVLVFGYLRIYNSSSILPLTRSARTTDLLLMVSYVTLAMPYMY